MGRELVDYVCKDGRTYPRVVALTGAELRAHLWAPRHKYTDADIRQRHRLRLRQPRHPAPPLRYS
jgi:hypothetical protein